MLNPGSPVPLYRQLAEVLTAGIKRGQYQPGGRIPSEPSLAEAYGIGRPTVRQAIEALVHKGLLIRRRGSGTFVTQPRQEVDLFSLDGTSASFHKQNIAVRTEIITPAHIETVADAAENPFRNKAAYHLSRLTLVDQTPVLVEELFLEAELFPGLERLDLHGRSLSAIAEEQYYLRPDRGKQSFEIGFADDEKAGLLQITAGAPVLRVRRYLHFPHKENGVFAKLWCRTDQFVFSQHIGGYFNG